MIKKSQFESMIVCKDRDFRHRCINFLNNIAFNAEKRVTESPEEAVGIMAANPRTMNCIIDGAEFPQLFPDGDLSWLKKICIRPEVMVIVYVQDENSLKSFKKDPESHNIFIFAMPFQKIHFNQAFHIRGESQEPPSGAGAESKGAGQTQASGQAARNILAFETSGHVKDTITMINIIGKNPEAIDQVMKVGQIFNGLVGALAYFENKAGCRELRHLAIMVDEISRYYTEEKKSRISDEHFQIFHDAAVTSFRILQLLRENKEVNPDLIRQSVSLREKYDGMQEFRTRETVDQDEIDRMLEDPDSLKKA